MTYIVLSLPSQFNLLCAEPTLPVKPTLCFAYFFRITYSLCITYFVLGLLSLRRAGKKFRRNNVFSSVLTEKALFVLNFSASLQVFTVKKLLYISGPIS